jgi:hypothetical protein
VSASKFGRQCTAVAALVAVVAAVSWVLAASAGADPLADCTASAGTIVAVDFSHWHGPVVRGCARNAANGLDLLHAAGFVTTGVVHDGPAFVCRLGNGAFAGGTQYPRPNEDPCVLTPPTNAYWSFWTSPPGSTRWSYSNVGAMSDVPRAGEVELWTFGGAYTGGATPAIAPSSLRAPASPPSTAAPPPSSPHATVAPPAIASRAPTTSSANSSSPAPPIPGAGSTRKGTSDPTAPSGARVHATTTTAVRGETVTRDPTPGSTATVHAIAAEPIRAQAHSSSGPPWSLVVALLVIGALGAGTVMGVRRRRLAAQSTESDS